MAEIYESFKDPRARAAIRHVVRAVVDMKGQIVTMVDRAYLTQAMPMLVVWGTDDVVIPAKHAENAARIAPGAVVEVLPNSGHFPHKDHPDRFVKIVQSFVRATQPASYHRGRWRQLLRNGPTEPVNRAEAGESPARPSPGCRGAGGLRRSGAEGFPGRPGKPAACQCCKTVNVRDCVHSPHVTSFASTGCRGSVTQSRPYGAAASRHGSSHGAPVATTPTASRRPESGRSRRAQGSFRPRSRERTSFGRRTPPRPPRARHASMGQWWSSGSSRRPNAFA